MPTRNINLTVEQDGYVEELVRSGKYQNASEVLRDALRGLEARRRRDELKLEVLRAQLRSGVEATETGHVTEVEDAGLEEFMEGLASLGDR